MKIPNYIKPWMSPNYVVIKSDNEGQNGSIPIAEVDEEILIALCDKFKEDVLAKARQPLEKMK